MTSQKLQMTIFDYLEEKLTLSVEDSHVKRSPKMENNEDLKTLEERFFSKLQEQQSISNLNTYSLRTSETYFHTTEEEHSKQSSRRWMNSGMMSSGKCITANVTDSHTTENESSLLQLLETNQDEKYFLSDQQLERLIERTEEGIKVFEATKKGYAIAEHGDSINLAVPGSKTRRGRVGKQVANTLDTSCNQAVVIGDQIKKLSPRECWRLQGFPDSAFDEAEKVNSNRQLYKQAGNSVSVPVIYEIAKQFK